MLRIAFGAPFDQLGVLIHHDKRMFNRNGGHLDPKHLSRPLRVVAAGGDNMLGCNYDLLVRGHKVAPLLDHLGDGDFPSFPVPVKRIGLPSAFDHHAALPRPFGHRHGDVGGVNVAVGIVIQRAFQIVGLDQRPFCLDLVWRHECVGHTAGFRGRRVEHVFVHTRVRLRHAQVADHGKARVQTGLFLERFIELDRIVMNVRRRKGHVEIGQQPRRVPSRARGQLVPLKQHHIIPSGAGQMIGNRCADGTAAHYQCFDLSFHESDAPPE